MIRAFGKMTKRLRQTAGEFRAQFDEALREARKRREVFDRQKGKGPSSSKPLQLESVRPLSLPPPPTASSPPPPALPRAPIIESSPEPAEQPARPSPAALSRAFAGRLAVPARDDGHRHRHHRLLHRDTADPRSAGLSLQRLFRRGDARRGNRAPDAGGQRIADRPR
eukprot:gene8409-11388_t